MNQGEYIGYMMAVLIVFLCVLFLIGKFIDMWYEKKAKEKKTDVYCPRDGHRLNTTELFHGHCFKCPIPDKFNSVVLSDTIRKWNCIDHIKKQSRVKS